MSNLRSAKTFNYQQIIKFLSQKKKIKIGKGFFFLGNKSSFSFSKIKSYFTLHNIFWAIFLILFFLTFFTTFPSFLIKAKFFITKIFQNPQEIQKESEIINKIENQNPQFQKPNNNEAFLPSGISEGEIKKGNILYIPSVGIKTNIVVMPEIGRIPSESEVQYYLKKGIVLYPYTARPGEIGNVVIFGHSSRYLWETGRYKYIFTLLDETNINNLVYIFWNGQTYIYRIYEKKVIEATQIEVTYSSGQSILSLVTCTPNSKRLLVRAQQIYPNPEFNRPANHPLLPNLK